MNAPSGGAAPSRAGTSRLFWVTVAIGGASLLIIPINTAIFVEATSKLPTAFYALAALQTLTGAVAAVCAIVHAARRSTKSTAMRVWSIVIAIVAALLALGGVVALFLVFVLENISGGAWGRPLRIRGRILHPGLSAGSDWTRGSRPNVAELDAPTRATLEALWLHDAQKEHASVPAFARISWLLAAVGAPADLLDWAHRAAREEIDHTRRCFALAAGYGGSSHTADAMPDLLVGGLDVKGDPLVHLAVESLKDGCLLEDFNADIAAACEAVCDDPATKDVLGRIAREERSHAEFSWAVVEWLIGRGGPRVSRAIDRESVALDRVPRPTAVADDKMKLVARANPTKMRAHGRIPDAEWAAQWGACVERTRRRARALVQESMTALALDDPELHPESAASVVQ